MTRVIDTAEALELLKAEVADKGEDHTVQCHYTAMSKGELVPVCIVGHLLVHLGVPIAKLASVNSTRAHVLFTDPAYGMGRYVQFTKGARELISYVQSSQDSRNPWGVAVSRGEAYTRGQRLFAPLPE